MGRWAPDARGRLERAALELYDEHGFDGVTVTGIAEHAGLAQRTFFRHFTDKREVLFGGSGVLQDLLVRRVADAPGAEAPLSVVVGAVAGADAVFPDDRELSRQRQRVIAVHPGLRERELIKLAELSAALAEALVARGVADRAARFAAEAGITVFKAAYARWLEESEERGFGQLVDDALQELGTVVAS